MRARVGALAGACVLDPDRASVARLHRWLERIRDYADGEHSPSYYAAIDALAGKAAP